ncbi:Mdm33 family-domain-containing protein [Crepidotus variabilis]|uniref:Sensitive to high expression protein 9, mitochondrial n=1 Tax=Crepidotus variabilis TaxID=179855 RepID=A0A9P6JWF7_9AGAR|nr:Mdm33 family-domain-containing protein [Crepidotus variabilis]
MLSSSRLKPTQLWRSFSTTKSTRNIQRPSQYDLNLTETIHQAPNSTSTKSSEPSTPDIRLPAPDANTVPILPSSPSISSSASVPLPEPSSVSTLQSTSTRKPESASEHLSEYDPAILKKRLREWTEQVAITLRHRADDFTTRSKTTFSHLGAELNKVTGYEEIEALKKGVSVQEQRIHDSRQAAREAKKAYEAAVLQRADSQREVNDLLQRKSIWTAADVARFTELVPKDHSHQQQEEKTKAAADEAEEIVEKEFAKLMRLILARYHEEQVWSDKIRSASTYGSLAALGLNMLVFIMAILVVEPWKRKRLAQTFEDKIVQLSSENGRKLEESMKILESQIGQQENLITALKGDVLNGVEQMALRVVAPVVVVDELPLKTVNKTDTIRTEPRISHGSLSLSGKNLEVAAVGAGAFVLGILGTMMLTR